MSKKLTLDALRHLSENKQKELSKRDPANKDIQVIMVWVHVDRRRAKNTFCAFFWISSVPKTSLTSWYAKPAAWGYATQSRQLK